MSLIYEFVQIDRPRVLKRLLQLMPDNVIPVFDLEDSHWVPGDASATEQNKSVARGKIITFCELQVDQINRRNISLRINNPTLGCMDQDMLVARALYHSLGLSCLMIPKVESRSTLIAVRSALARYGLQNVQIAPIVETASGIERIENIAAAAKEFNVTSLIYGFHDYWYETRVWPFPSAHEAKYWLPVLKIVEKLMDHDLRYVSPPEPRLKDLEILQTIYSRLTELCGEKFDFLSAGRSQTKILSEIILSEYKLSYRPVDAMPSKDSSIESKIERAKMVCLAYKENKRTLESFASDPSSSYFISPHEYESALQFLKDNKVAVH